MSTDAREDDGHFLPMEDPDWNPKSAKVERPTITPKPKNRMTGGSKAAVGVWVIFVVALVFIPLSVWSCNGEKPKESPPEPPRPAFGNPSEDKLILGADGKSGYLLTTDGKLFQLSGPQAVEIVPATQPAGG